LEDAIEEKSNMKEEDAIEEKYNTNEEDATTKKAMLKDPMLE